MKQQELEALLQEVLSQCKEINIPVSNHIMPYIYINRRAKSRFASCRKVQTDSGHNHLRNTHFQIEVCEAMLEADEGHIKNVLAHELLHTCYGCYNHGKRWKSYAYKMNKTYGYDITTTADYEKMGLERPEKKENYKYRIECKKCGKIFYRRRKSILITNISGYRCKCGGKLECTQIK